MRGSNHCIYSYGSGIGGAAVIFYNAKIHTMTSEDSCCGAMEVKHGRITRLFSEPEAEKISDLCRNSGFLKSLFYCDLNGAHVYPCLIDPHVHLLLTVAVMAKGFSASEITENGVEPDTLKGIEEKIRSYPDKKHPAAINNYIRSAIKEKRMPSREELDEWAEGGPVVVYSIDGHSTALSSEMLRLIGIDPKGHSGILSGEANENAQEKITKVIKRSIGVRDLLKGIRAFDRSCREYGICMVGALDDFLTPVPFLTKTKTRIYLQTKDINKVKRLGLKRIGGCGAWETDGAVGSRSAAFNVPYLDTKKTAPVYMDASELKELCRRADEAGLQIASHAIGEAAIEALFEGLSSVSSDRLHRIEHCEFIDDKTFEKLKCGRFAVVAQPGYSWIDKRYLHTYEEALPESVLKRLKFRSFMDNGIIMCGSSDSPVQDLNPFLQMAGMTQFYNEEESVTPYQALMTYTVNAAKAMEVFKDYGTLEPGKRARFFTSRKDFFKLTPGEILEFRPERTY